MDRYATALAVVAIALSGLAGAQTPTIPPSVELTVSARWLYGGQRPSLVPFKQRTFWMFLHTEQPRVDVTGRRAHVVFDSPNYASQSTTIEAPPDGHFPHVSVRTETTTVRRDVVFAAQLSLPASRLWELIPSFHPSRLRSGEQWTDTLSFAAEQSGFRQALAGVRLSTLLGDTIVDGRRLWIVRDSGAVTYEENATEPGHTLEDHMVVERRATGVLTGRALVDPASSLLHARFDTAILAGKAVLHSSGGQTYETSARLEWRRRWIAYDSGAYDSSAYMRAYLRTNFEQPPATLPAILVASPSDIQRRLVAGDSSYKDSLLAVLRRTQDPNERAFLLSRPVSIDTSLRRQIHEIRIASGDSAYRLELLTDRLGRAGWTASSTIDGATMRQGIALMDDLGALLVLQRDDVFGQLSRALVWHPPAMYTDTTLWPCTPAACRLLASQWRTAREPRLRELGLVAHFTLQPKAWIDTILADTTALLEDARLLARGVGATLPSESREPIPLAGAPWQAWLEWMVGQSRAYVDPDFGPNTYASRMRNRKLRFDQTHAAALRFTQARTGRNIVGELRQMLAQATSDSAKLVLEFMLYRLGEYQPTVASVEEHLRSRSRLSIKVGIDELPNLFNRSPPLADTATRTLLTGRLIESAFTHEQAWPMLDAEAIPFQLIYASMSSAANERILLQADSVPPSLRAKWNGHLVSGFGAARIRDLRDIGILVTVHSVTRLGPFAHLDVDVRGSGSRRLGSTDYPEQYFASWDILLMQLNGEWVVVKATLREPPR